jgi:molecular chaperone DnaJ
MHDVYEVLGLPPGAGQERIKAAFRELAKRFHPDVNVGDPAAEQRFKEINRAYQILSDPEARAVHERACWRAPASLKRLPPRSPPSC